MIVPEVLSVREFRADLAATVARVSAGAPVFVGAHRKPEVVVMSVEQYEALVRSAEQRQAVTEALASVRAEGLEPSWDALEGLEKLARGEIDEDELIKTLRRRYQQ